MEHWAATLPVVRLAQNPLLCATPVLTCFCPQSDEQFLLAMPPALGTQKVLPSQLLWLRQ
jgi:hypothetical protein